VADAINRQIIEVVYRATEAERAAQQRSNNERRRIKQEADDAKKAGQQRERDFRDLMTGLDRLEKERERKSKQTANEELRAWRQSHRERHQLVMSQWRDQQEALKKQQQQWDSQGVSIIGAGKAVAGFGLAMVGLNSASAILNQILERFQALRVAAMQASSDVINQAGRMRSLAALEGNFVAPTQTLLGITRLRAETQQSPEAAEAMVKAAKASGFGAIQAGRVSASDFDAFLKSQGRLQTLLNEDPAAIGKMAGLLPLVTGKPKSTTADLEALSERLFEIQRLGGFESYSQSATQLGIVSPYVMKGVYTAPVAQAFLSAFALGGEGGRAAEYLEQATRATSAGILRNRGMQIAPGYEQDYQRSAAYFKSLGVTTQTPAEDRFMPIIQDIIKQEDAAKAAGKYFSSLDYLLEKGFVNQEDRQALANLAGVHRIGLLEPLLAKAHQPLGGSTMIADAWQRAEADPVFIAQQAQIAAELRQQEAGVAGGVGTFKAVMQQQAYATLGGKTALGGDVDEIMSQWYFQDIIFQRRRRIELEAQRMVHQEARKAGVDLGGDWKDPKFDAFAFRGWDVLFDVGQKTRERTGGGPLAPGVDPARLARAMENFTLGLERFTGQGLPAAAPMQNMHVGGAAAGQKPPALAAPQPPGGGIRQDSVGVP
jgi:hypothetical protein